MSDFEIDRKLALAIGWPESWTRKHPYAEWFEVSRPIMYKETHLGGYVWVRFDHHDPRVIWPIAVKYNAFPMNAGDGDWIASTGSRNHFGTAKNPRATTTVALAIIEALGK